MNVSISPKFAAITTLNSLQPKHIQNWVELTQGDEGNKLLGEAMKEYDTAAEQQPDRYDVDGNEVLFYSLEGQTGAIGGSDLLVLRQVAHNTLPAETIPGFSAIQAVNDKMQPMTFWNVDEAGSKAISLMHDFIAGKIKSIQPVPFSL